MRIGINALLCSPSSSYRNAGISRYIRQLVTAMGECQGLPEMHLFLSGANRDHFPAGFVQHHTGWTTESPLVRIAWEQLALPVLAKSAGLDILHSPMHVLPAVCPCRSVVTVLDFSFMRFPQSYPTMQRRYLEHFTRCAVRKAGAIIAISESTKRDIVELLGIPENRIFVTPLGVDAVYQPASPELKELMASKHGIKPGSILYLGTLEPRKNVPTLLAAYSRAKKRLGDAHRLILAGGKGWFYDQVFKLVDELGLSDSVHFTGYVPTEDLPALYSTAAVFVYPSLYEGFGLPPLEAMACGTPVITSNSSSLPEVVGEAGITVDPHDVDGLADAIVRVLTDGNLQMEMSRMGLARARRFTWEETAHRTLDVYKRVCTC